MSTHTQSSRSIRLALPPDEQWTLHHVLLHRIERERTAENPTGIDPPPLEVYRAFETLDAGESRFTAGQLEAVQDVLGTYQRSTDWWELERSTLEQLLHRVATALEHADGDTSR
ncbi:MULTISPECIES: hypothetical protein [Halorussus]|uniref:DUF7853 family protein n=1 Tax=Halorussus TaxID=1070314 RepID=UPI00209DB8D1|nr:hypothetical protein [Halorussus vallis]USZ76009.1 hypothetical protein NGM07_01490 [Halorussus vallis]